MYIIYANKEKIFRYGLLSIDLNNYIKPSDLKQICYDYDSFAILTWNNKIIIFNNVSNPSDPIQFNIDKTIKFICFKSNRLLIYNESGKLYYISNPKDLKDGMTLNNYFILNDTSIISINSCTNCDMILKDNDGVKELWCLGDRENALYGIGQFIYDYQYIINRKNNKYYYVKLLDKTNININIKYIYCGGCHCIIQDENNKLYVFGENKNGQLGIDNYQNQYDPILLNLESTSKIKKICCEWTYSLILMENGEIWAFGTNYTGIMGPRVLTYLKPHLIFKKDDIKDLWCSDNNCVIIEDTGKLLILGCDNRYIPYIISEVKNLIFVLKTNVNIEWNLDRHLNYNIQFKNNTLFLLLLLKRFHKMTSIKIPRFVIYEIIKILFLL